MSARLWTAKSSGNSAASTGERCGDELASTEAEVGGRVFGAGLVVVFVQPVGGANADADEGPVEGRAGCLGGSGGSDNKEVEGDAEGEEQCDQLSPLMHVRGGCDGGGVVWMVMIVFESRRRSISGTLDGKALRGLLDKERHLAMESYSGNMRTKR